MRIDSVALHKPFRVEWFASIVLLVTLADQFTKMAAAERVESSPRLAATHIAPPALIFGPLAVCTALWAIILIRRVGNHWPLLAVPLRLVVGGALSNIGEATVQGAVTDFIVIGPIATNVADLAMMIGVLSLIPIVPYIYSRRRSHSARWPGES